MKRSKVQHKGFRFAEVTPDLFLVYQRYEFRSRNASVIEERLLGEVEYLHGSWGWNGGYPTLLRRALAEFEAARVAEVGGTT